MLLTWIGLPLAFASALVTNTAYSLDHDAAAALPPAPNGSPYQVRSWPSDSAAIPYSAPLSVP